MRLDKCNGGVDNETVVFAHKNGAGIGQKFLDENGKDVGAYLCYYCHQVYDGSIRHEYYNKLFVEEMFEFAMRETSKKLKEKNLL